MIKLDLIVIEIKQNLIFLFIKNNYYFINKSLYGLNLKQKKKIFKAGWKY